MCGRGSAGVSIPAVCYMVFSVYLLVCVGDTRAVFQALRGTFKLPMTRQVDRVELLPPGQCFMSCFLGIHPHMASECE